MSSTLASERYRVVDRIGEGGVGVVYRVEDQLTGAIRAMKVIPRTSGLANLRGEFLALARLDHDNIVRVHDYGLTDAGHDFFTMDYVDGPSLLEAVPSADDPAFYPTIGGILRALAFLHARGTVHADIKPSNILIDREALAKNAMNAPRLVDFGLAANVSDPAASAARGTFPYAAPEVYAGRLDARSDLYAVGVVLYELATRTKPFGDADVKRTLIAQQRGQPQDPRELEPSIPGDLAELILGLLEPVPSARPQTADEVLARINQIAGTSFAIADSRPLVDIKGELVGRDRDTAELETMWTAACEGAGGVALVSGEEGIGKSRLLAELKLRTQLAGGWATSASATRVTGVAYPGIAAIVRGLLADLGEPAERPALAPLFGARGDVALLDPDARFALAEAVAAVVLEAAAVRPRLVEIDDVEHADPSTLELLAYLARAASAGKILLVLAVQRGNLRVETPRSKRASTAPPYVEASDDSRDAIADRLADLVATLPRGRKFELPPLDRESVRMLVANAFGPDIARALAAELHRASGGNPAHAAHALKTLVEMGAVRRQRGKWILTDSDVSIPMPPSAVASALARADALPGPARDALYTASVLGERFRRDDLAALMDQSLTDIAPALVEAAASNLIGADIGAGWFYFLNPEVAGALYTTIDHDVRLGLHRRAAEILSANAEAEQDVPPDALASHYLAIEDEARALKWSQRAAEAREDVRDHHGALLWYLRARPFVPAGDPTGARIDEHTGELRSLLGDVPGACNDMRQAYEAIDEDDPAHVRVGRRLGHMLRRRGDSEESIDVLMTALESARRLKLDREEALCQFALGDALMFNADYGAAMQHAIAGHLIARARGDRTLAADLGKLRANIEIYQGSAPEALIHLEDSLADAQAAGVDVDIAEIQFGIGRAAVHAGDYARAIDSYEKAIPVLERVGRIEKAARSLNNLGAACYFQGDWARARESWERFRDLCERLDDTGELVNALNNLGSLYRDLGELGHAQTTLERAAMLAELSDHPYMGAMVQGNRGDVLFRQADMASARREYEEALARFEAIGAKEFIAECKRRLCEVDIAIGRPNEALDRAIDAIRIAQDARSKFEEGILHRVAASALRQQGDLDSAAWFCERSRELIGALGARFERAKVDLEAGEIAAAQGDGDTAVRLVDTALEAFADLGARWHLSRARNRRRALNPTSSPSMPAGRFNREALVEVARAAGQLELDQLLDVVLTKILDVSGFERGFILLLDGEGRPSERKRRTRGESPAFGADDAEFSGSIVRRVAGSGEAVAVLDIAGDTALRNQASIIALGLRQVLCVPMYSRGRVFGIVYVDSRRLPRDDRDADLSLLEALTAQASVAVENARLVAEERRKSELMGVLAHEIRNPLAGILGFSHPEEAARSGAKGELAESFGHIHRDAQRLKRLVDNVLELTRHEAGNADWSMASFSMADVVEQVSASFAAATRERDIKVVLEIEGSPGGALGNPDRITQVVTNLIGNAAKFSPEGGVITLRVSRESVSADDPQAPPAPASDVTAWAPLAMPEERDYIRVDVIDEGPGMSEDLRTRLFQKFSQGADKRSKGVGLGLYISREIIERHGGSIWVESEPGKGAAFSFRVPCVESR